MGEKGLAWHLLVSGLADVKDADLRLLDDLMSRDAEFPRRASKSTKERLALKVLKYFSGMVGGKEPSDHQDSEEIPLDMSPEKVLFQLLKKPRIGSHISGQKIDELRFKSHALQKYISSKEDALSKSHLHELKKQILERHPAAISTVTKSSALPSEETQPDCKMENRNAKRHKIDYQDVNPQSRIQISPSLAPGNIQDCSACPEKEKQNMDKLSTTIFPDVQMQSMPACHTSTDFKKAGTIFAGNTQDCSAFPEKEKQNTDKLSTTIFPDVQMQSMPASHTNTDLKKAGTISAGNIQDCGACPEKEKQNMDKLSATIFPDVQMQPMPACHTNTDLKKAGTISAGNIQDCGACPEKEKQNMGKLSTTIFPDVQMQSMAAHTNTDLKKAGAISAGNIQDCGACPEKEKQNMDKLSTTIFPDVQMQSMPACHTNTDLKKAGTISAGNIQDFSACPEKEKQNMDKLSTTIFSDVQMQSMPAHTNTDLSGKKSSSTLPDLHEKGIVNASLDAECNSTRELPDNITCNLTNDSRIINGGHRQLLRQTSTTTVVNKSNKSLQRESSEFQNPSDISKKSHGVPLVTGYSDSLYKSQNNIIELLEENFQNHEASANIPAELLLIRNCMHAYLSRLLAHVGVDSVTGDWAAKGFCMECLDDGASLSCKSCCFTFHERCLDPLARSTSPGHFRCPLCSYRKALELLQGALKEAKHLGRVFRTLSWMEVPQGHQKRASSVPDHQEPNLLTACGSVNPETSVATDHHQGCNKSKRFVGAIEQTGHIDATQVGNNRKSPNTERVNLASDVECAVFHSAGKLDAGVGSELELPNLQDIDHATLNKENILATELFEVTNHNHQVESRVDIANSVSFHNVGPSHVGEANHILDAEREKVLSPENDRTTLNKENSLAAELIEVTNHNHQVESCVDIGNSVSFHNVGPSHVGEANHILDAEREKALSPGKDQPGLQHIENDEQNEAALNERNTGKESPNEMHAKRRRQDKLTDSISGPIMASDQNDQPALQHIENEEHNEAALNERNTGKESPNEMHAKRRRQDKLTDSISGPIMASDQNDQPALQHIENEEQNEAALNERNTGKESPNEMHAKRRRQDKLTDSISGPIMASDQNDQPALQHIENEEQNEAALNERTTGNALNEMHAKRRRRGNLTDSISGPIMTSDLRMSKRATHQSKRYSNPIAPPGRRNKLKWTEEEEQALMEAMKEYIGKDVKKFPWTNILELHRNKFHKTRIPIDLRVKWRIMNRVKDQTKSDKTDESDDPVEPDESIAR